MKPYFTILLDSFRMLKSKAIFWVTLGISMLVALVYLSLGFTDQGVSVLFGAYVFENDLIKKGSPMAELFYIGIFAKYIAEWWLSWIAVLLGLISCGAIFPDAMKEGSAGVLLTKKPSRLSVFLAKFAGSLLFVAIQVGLFMLIVFIALRWRVGEWNFSVFWYVPLILLVFTYLYSFMVLIAVKTRSVMTALLLTLVLWAVSSIVGAIEGYLYIASEFNFGPMGDPSLVEEQPEPPEGVIEEQEPEDERSVEVSIQGEEDVGSDELKLWHGRIKAFYGLLPKTGRTMEIADRLLVVNGKKGFARGSFLDMMMGTTDLDDENPMSEMETMSANRHSVSYAIGTSLVFAFVMLSLAARSFCRRDH